MLPTNKSHTLAMRWVGEDIKPRAQGTKADGRANATECLQELLADKNVMEYRPNDGMKPYGLAVGLFFYTFAALSIKMLSVVTKKILQLFA
jgi:hypothetical protein